MNSETSNTWVQFQQYDKPEAQQLIQSVKTQLGQDAKEAGKRDAESNLPRKGDKLLLFISHLLVQIQGLINDLRNLHKADEDVALAIEKQERILEQSRNERDDMQSQYAQVQKDYQYHKDSFPSVMAIVISVIILLLGLMEGLISLHAIRTFVPNYLTALFTALIYGLCLTILAHQVMRWWNMGKSPAKRLVIRSLIISGISGAFYLMGLLRSGQINMSTMSLEDSTTGTLFSYADPTEAFLFMCISWVVFLPAVLLTKLAPTKEQWFSIFKARSLKKAVKDSQRKLDELLQRITTAEGEIHNLRQYEVSRNKAATRDEEDALSLVEYVKANYIQSNIRHRLDKSVVPNSLDQKLHYPLTTYFQNTSTPKSSKK